MLTLGLRRHLMVFVTRFLPLYVVLLVLPANAAAQTASFSFQVHSTKGWQPTTLQVTAGQQLSFSVAGKWNVDHRNFSYVGPEGYSPEEDSRIFQGCKLGPEIPYGKLLVRAGDDPSFVVIGTSEGTFMPNRDGLLSFRIHDADACLGDNAGSLRVTVTGSGLTAGTTPSPIFYCITSNPPAPEPDQVKVCDSVQETPVATKPVLPPAVFGSQSALACTTSFYSIEKGLSKNGNKGPVIAIAMVYATYYTKFLNKTVEVESKLDRHLNPFGDPLDTARYALIIAESLGEAAAELVADAAIHKSCFDWAAEILAQFPDAQL